MNLEQPCSVGGGLVALRYHLANFSLLLRRQLRTTSADAPLFPGGIQPGPGSFLKHHPFELAERPEVVKQKMLKDGKLLKPILIISPEHGRFMGAMLDGGDVVTDGAGKPVAFRDL